MSTFKIYSKSGSVIQGPAGAAGPAGPAGAAGVDVSSIDIYTKATLPLNDSTGNNVIVSDGTVNNTPTMAYFYQGKWYRTFDNSLITDQTIDLFILAGQSNAHGHADVSTLTSQQSTQNGLFYTSWHQDTSNAETTQYYSNWESSLVAGSTRGDSNNLVNSTKFGPELGFVSRANAITLTTQPIGIIKYAVGASQLNAGNANYSDWDTTATGNREGDCYRGLLSVLSDATTKLDNAGYSWNFKGMIWWQGESGSSVSGLQTFITTVRNLLSNNYNVSIPAQFPVVITKIGYGTDLTPVANADAYVGIVDAGTYGHSSNQNHIGTDSEGSYDLTGNGVNDMFDIGEAYADQMQLAITGSTNASWTPSSITTRLWLDMDDQATFSISSGNVSAIADKSGNNYTFNASGGSTITAINSVQNNRNILRFDGNSDSTSYTNIGFSATARHKWFFVVKVTNSDALDALFTFTKSNPLLQMILFNLSGNGVFSGDWYMNPGIHLTGNSSNLLNQWVMLAVEFDVPNSQSTAWLNATAYDSNIAQTGLSGMGPGSVQLNNYQNNADSDWGEIVLTEDLSQTNSDKIEGYLAHKWGLVNELPISHPYKTSAP